MSQALDLRRSIRIIRRYKTLVGAFIVFGAALGAAYAMLSPPLQTSTALVVLPQAIPGATASQTTGQDATTPYMQTQVLIAGSTPVLTAARPQARPVMALDALRKEVDVSSPTAYIIQISARGKTAADAEATANAVASSYISYIGSVNSPLGAVSARLLQPAATASGVSRVVAAVAFGLAGAAGGAFIGVIAAVAIGRKDRHLRERDAIANAIGIPVLASLVVSRPNDVAGWTRLLADYRPGAVQAWRMRRALQQLGLIGRARTGGSSITVLSLASDPRALAIGPQLAAYAASSGVPTALLIGPQQHPSVTATLRTACSGLRIREGGLRTVVWDRGLLPGMSDEGSAREELTVVVVVVDGRFPRMSGTPATATTVLAVSAGGATGEQLARAAVSVAEDGREIAGIFVADPEPGDLTTGQIPQLGHPVRHRMPSRLNGSASAGAAGGGSSRSESRR